MPGPSPLPRPGPSPDPTPPPLPGPAPAVPVLPVPSPVVGVDTGAVTTCCAGVTGDSTGGFGSGGFTGGTVAGVTLGITVGSDFTRTNWRCSAREPDPLVPPPPPPAGPGPPPPTTSGRVKSEDPTIGARTRKRIIACTRSDAVIPFHRSSFLRGKKSGGCCCVAISHPWVWSQSLSHPHRARHPWRRSHPDTSPWDHPLRR